MKEKNIESILEQIKAGNLPVSEAMEQLKDLPFKELGYAKIDHHREIRNGYPEVILCEGKELEHIVGIVEHMLETGNNIFLTRASREVYEALEKITSDLEYHPIPRIIVVKKREVEKTESVILVATGGTADIKVAEEAALTAEILGNTVERLYDVGVAGIHRLLKNTDKLQQANVIIAVAGMEGALPSVIGGLVDKPVIAVPTSVGYGANFQGLSALLTMLNSCASGIGVVNIDNGFGGGYLAGTINRQIEKARRAES
ncbi:nickel pincer cofactor biosynthesis protein LarB [Isachenkonia alkalipeptolytica]|uniref:nickel pincer cofactor biosynthesis protein LarB n=1 Tax=Isachenkonia alkalipeptolytica TaxID=2565777 RepID=UPI00191BDCEC|nr:nickel pincer cofactor biosynthesis protein LarB [Isachenkonia alkalipeptolytica]